MSQVHPLTLAQAQKELTEAVKRAQGSKKTASWKAAARPGWWIDEHPVTLADGSQICTGTFDNVSKRRWKKSHFQAALFLYEQWKSTNDDSEGMKEETKVEEEIQQPSKPAPRRKKGRAKKEEHVLQQSSPVPRKKKVNTKQRVVTVDLVNVTIPETGQPEPVEEVEEPEKHTRIRGRRNPRSKQESVIPKEDSTVQTPNTRPNRQESSSDVQSDESPTPIVRRRRARARGRPQKTSPQIHTPLRKPPSRSNRPRRTGKALVRNTHKSEPSGESVSASDGVADIDSNPSSRGSASNSDEDFMPNRTRHRTNQLRRAKAPAPQNHRRMSPRLSGLSTESSPTSDSPKTKKRPISDAEEQAVIGNSRTPFQERTNRSNLQDKRSRKKRRITDSDNAPSDKENQAPSKTAKSKSTKLRSAPGKKGKSVETEIEPNETETVSKDDGNEEEDYADLEAELKKDMEYAQLLRDSIAEVKAIKDHSFQEMDCEFEAFKDTCNNYKRQAGDMLRNEYRTMRLKFSKKLLDMPMSTFANDHGGSTFEWMVHDTEEAVNRTFQAINNGEAPNEGAMGPPRTPTAMSRRAALTRTARKTRRRVEDEAVAAGLTVRRSQRTAAKVATERTRRIVSCTPRTRTAKKEVKVQGNASASVCSRQQFSKLAQSIRKTDNPVEALRAFTDQLQREVLEG